MWTHLWFKLTSAFALIMLIGVIVTTLLTRQGADAHFAHFMVEHHMVRPEVMVQTLANYYIQRQGWGDADTQFPVLVEAASDGVMSGMMGSMMGMANNRIQVIDQQGHVIADTRDSMLRSAQNRANSSSRVLTGQAVQRWPILVDHREAGTLLIEGAMMTASPLRNIRLLQGVTRAVLLAGLTTGIIGVLLAWLLIRLTAWPTIYRRRKRCGAIWWPMWPTNFAPPLAGIQGTVEAIQNGVFPLTVEQIGSIHEQVMLLNRLVEDLRTLTNAEAGQLPLHKAPLDLVGLCKNQVQAFQAHATAQQINLQLTVQTHPPMVHADSQRVEQVLNNLLSNALRHTPVGGVVEVTVSVVPQGVQVAVTDSGEGIAAGELGHIFDRFYRLDQSRNHLQCLLSKGQ